MNYLTLNFIGYIQALSQTNTHSPYPGTKSLPREEVLGRIFLGAHWHRLPHLHSIEEGNNPASCERSSTVRRTVCDNSAQGSWRSASCLVPRAPSTPQEGATLPYLTLLYLVVLSPPPTRKAQMSTPQ